MQAGVKRRMLRTAKGVVPAGQTEVAPLFGAALSRAAQDRLSLPIDVAQCAMSALSLGEFLSPAEEGGGGSAMILRLRGRDGASGICRLSPDTSAALIEMHVMRQLRAAAPAPRRPTRADAAVVMPLLDLAFEILSLAVADAPSLVWASDWRCEAFAPDPRPLALSMPDVPYRRLALALAIGEGGARAGELELCLPSPAEPVAVVRRDPDAEWPGRLASATLASEAIVGAVLCRVTVPLSQALALRPGGELSLPAGAIGSVRLESLAGQRLATGRLGQAGGRRAVRIEALASPDMRSTGLAYDVKDQPAPHGGPRADTSPAPADDGPDQRRVAAKASI